MPQIPAEKIIELDVCPILDAGGEPFNAIVAAAGKVPAGGALRLIAPFEPVPLFHFLGSQGFDYKVESSEGGTWVILFYQQKAESCGSGCCD